MKTDKNLYLEMAAVLKIGGGRKFGAATAATLKWGKENKLSKALFDLFEVAAPKSEVWAGAGALYAEKTIVRWNNDFPEALKARLLIIGSAANGDHITIDLKTGEVGYLDHESDWAANPRKHFIVFSPSLGSFVQEINGENQTLPDDYHEAKAMKQKP